MLDAQYSLLVTGCSNARQQLWPYGRMETLYSSTVPSPSEPLSTLKLAEIGESFIRSLFLLRCIRHLASISYALPRVSLQGNFCDNLRA